MSEYTEGRDARSKVLEKVLDDQDRARYARGRKGGLKRSLMDKKDAGSPDDCIRNTREARAETVGRWRASRSLARKLLEQLTQYSLDAARETCYTVIMQLDALQRGEADVARKA